TAVGSGRDRAWQCDWHRLSQARGFGDTPTLEPLARRAFCRARISKSRCSNGNDSTPLGGSTIPSVGRSVSLDSFRRISVCKTRLENDRTTRLLRILYLSAAPGAVNYAFRVFLPSSISFQNSRVLPSA